MTQKILICNDNNKILESITHLLNEQKIKFDLANSYQVLLDLAQKQVKKAKPYPVILTDLTVNKEKGDDILEQLCDKSVNSTIIALYSYNDYSIEWLNSKVRENNNILFLKKPFEDLELVQLIKNNLKSKNELNAEQVSDDFCDYSSTTKNLLDNISHEIRTPLASIVGIAEVLGKTRLNDEQTRHVNSILRCSDSLLNIITDMIDFEIVQDQAINIHTNDFCFTDLLEGCVNLISRQAFEKDVDVNLSISDNVPSFIHSDESKLRKLVWNLLTNAVKYTNYGNVTVFCDYEKKNDENTLTIQIKDTGIGIDPDSLKTLFTKFEKHVNPYRSGGSGIGLSMTKKLLDAFKGEIDVKSVVDQGSVFTIKIPVATVYDKSLQLQFGKFTPLNETKGIFISTNKLTSEAIIPQFAKQNCDLEHANTIREARIKIQQTDEKLTWCVIDDSLATNENIPLLKNLLLSCQQNGIKTLLVSKTQSSINMLHTIGIQRFINKPCLERDIRKVLSYHSDTSKDSSFAPSLIPMDKIRKAKSLKILIAEDNEINQMVLSDMIKRNGHQFEIAKHGKIAADKASMSKYDLIFMDLQMPIMNGIEATKRIRVEDKKTPIIAMTSNIRESIKQECELAGMQDVLTKPITEATLVNILQTYAK